MTRIVKLSPGQTEYNLERSAFWSDISVIMQEVTDLTQCNLKYLQNS